MLGLVTNSSGVPSVVVILCNVLAPPPPGGGTHYSGLYGKAPPERGAFMKLAGKIAFLVYERVTKSAAK